MLPTDPRHKALVLGNLIRMGWVRLTKARGAPAVWCKTYPPRADISPGSRFRVIAREGGAVWAADVDRAKALTMTEGHGLHDPGDRLATGYQWRPRVTR